VSEFLEVLTFSILPFVMVLAFSFVVPGMGAILALRNEIMLALALPSVANALLSFGMFIGIEAENKIFLYIFTTVITFAIMLFAINKKSSASIRELRLAGLFAGGQIFTMLFTALSPSVHAHIEHIFNGEIMGVGMNETLFISGWSIIILVYGVKKEVLFIHGVLMKSFSEPELKSINYSLLLFIQ
jgi:hypothetical protein